MAASSHPVSGVGLNDIASTQPSLHTNASPSKLQSATSSRSTRRKQRRVWDVVADNDGYVTLHDGVQVPLRRHAPYFFLLPYERSEMLSFPGGILTIHLLHVTDINQDVVKKLFPHLFIDNGPVSASDRNSSVSAVRSSRSLNVAAAPGAVSAAAVLSGETHPSVTRALAYYIRIEMGLKIVITHAVFNVAAHSTQFIIDVLRHMLLTLIIPEELHDSNTVKLELIAFEHDQHHVELSPHKLIGRAYVHLYSCIHHIVIDKKMRLTREAVLNVRSELDLAAAGGEGAKIEASADVNAAVPLSRRWADEHDAGDLEALGLEEVGNLHAKVCFAYGRYGYGCSNQLHDSARFSVDFIKHSQFPRIEPQSDRRAVEGNIMPPRSDVDIQKLIPFRMPPLRIGNLQLSDETVPRVLTELFGQSKIDADNFDSYELPPDQTENSRFCRTSRAQQLDWFREYLGFRGKPSLRLSFLRKMCAPHGINGVDERLTMLDEVLERASGEENAHFPQFGRRNTRNYSTVSGQSIPRRQSHHI